MIALIIVGILVVSINGSGMDEFLTHSGSTGTQNMNNLNVTNAGLPHLPRVDGFMGTHGTFRFLSIMEQTGWLVGEPKHGLWRIQENGMIREYRKKGKIGLRDGVNPNDRNLSQANKDIIESNYAHYIPEESWEGYKYPDDRISKGDGTYDDLKDYVNFIDLSIHHPKYKGKYDSHVPIDLPFFYCTMSQNDYPYVWNSWKYALAQPLANKMGPLARRAGLDIKENYMNVLQFDFVHDGGLWVNVGNNDPTNRDLKLTNKKTQPSHIQNVNYQRVSFEKMNIESYLVERTFFNKPYLFIIAIMENKVGPSDFSFVRNDGAYWNDLVRLNKASAVKNHVANHYPFTSVENYPSPQTTSRRKIYGLPVYGTHHPNRRAHKMTGGACPERGGDWGRYPWSNSGSGFPTNYEEITPICDAAVIDMKLAINLWEQNWADPRIGLANSAYQTNVVDYHVDRNVYGVYTDPYLIRKNESNPTRMDLTEDGNIVEPNEKSKQKSTVIKLRFAYLGKMLDFNRIPLRSTKETCPVAPTCPPVVTPTCPAKPCYGYDEEKGPEWGNNILIIVCVVLALLVLELIAIILVFDRIRRNKEKREKYAATSGQTNPTFTHA